MHAEVAIRFADEIRVEWLTNGLPAASDPQSVLSLTYFRYSVDLLSSVVYARRETSFVYLVFKDDGRSIRVLVEGRVTKGDLRQLVRQSEHVSNTFVRAGESHGCTLESATIYLHANEDLITTGVRRGFGERLLGRFAETIFGDVMVGLFTGLLTGVITREWLAASVAAVASVLCFFAWLAIEIRGGRDAYEYAGL
jgi:hypothetical protein